jgi:hypothetical protein
MKPEFRKCLVHNGWCLALCDSIYAFFFLYVPSCALSVWFL